MLVIMALVTTFATMPMLDLVMEKGADATFADNGEVTQGTRAL